MRALALIFLLCLSTAARADQGAPQDTRIRAAVQKSLAFLEKGGVQWHEEKNCLACHHIPFMAWSHVEAGRRGIAVDQTKLKEWLEWCVEWAEPKGGDDVLAQLLLFLPREVMTAPEAQKKFESLPPTLLGKQKPDGSWTASGQFKGQQWPAKEADEVATMRMLLALNTPWVDAAKTAAKRELATAWLKESTKTQGADLHTLSLTQRLLYDHRLGDGSRKEALTKTLLSQQKADGGWSWKLGNEGSDPIATGEVLHVLSVTGDPAFDAASRQRAVEYLLKTQLEDGSWFQDHKRISAKIRKEPKPVVDGIYSYFATGWATMGLLQTLPVASVADTGKP